MGNRHTQTKSISMKISGFALSILSVCALCIVPLQSTIVLADSDAGTRGSDTTIYWPEFRGNANNTGYSISSVPNINNVFLDYDVGLGTFIRSSPAVFGDFLYFGTDVEGVFAINISTGLEEWNFTTFWDFWATPLVIGDMVYIGSTEGHLYAFNRYNGSMEWTTTIGGIIASSAKYYNGIIIAASRSGNVSFLDASTGSEVSTRFMTDGEIWGTPAVVGNTIIIGSNDGNVSRVYINNATQMWRFQLPPTISGRVKFTSAAVHNDTVFIGSNDYNFYALDLATGSLKWTFQTGHYIYASPAVHQDKVFVHSTDHYLYALPINDPNSDGTIDSGEVLWSFLTGDGTGADHEGGSSPAVADGKILVGSNTGFIYCIDEQTGTEIWNYSLLSGTFSSPAIADGKIYIGTSIGRMYGFAESAPGMMVTISPESSIVESQRSIEILFNVTKSGLPVEGAFISFAVSAGILSQSGASTLADGIQRVKYLSPIVSENTTVRISATATKYGMKNAVASISITVIPAEGYGDVSGTTFSLEKYLGLIVMIIILTAVNVVILIFISLKRRKSS